MMLRSETGAAFIELGLCADSQEAQDAVAVAQAEVGEAGIEHGGLLSLGTEPSYFKTTTARGAFMAWNRGRYYFSVHAKGGENELDRFMQAFPH